MSENTQNSERKQTNNKDNLQDIWAIRSCHLYKDEYADCKSFKARFNQYFIYGQDVDCSQWLTDFKNCERYEESNGTDMEAGRAIIKSEEVRRLTRMRAHYANDTWKKREQPPQDWSKPLPDWMEKRNENSYLDLKQKELSGLVLPEENQKSFCALM